jgi:hypothetical protein
LDIREVAKKTGWPNPFTTSWRTDFELAPTLYGTCVVGPVGDTTLHICIDDWQKAGRRTQHEPQIIVLSSSACRFGGERWWFICPKTQERVVKLYIPAGENELRSRKGWALSYEVQRMAPLERREYRARRAFAELGASYHSVWDVLPDRPVGMRQKRFLRLERLADAASEAHFEAFAKAESAIFKPCGVRDHGKFLTKIRKEFRKSNFGI